MLTPTPETTTWLAQFDAADRTAAQALLGALRFVSASEFSQVMNRLLSALLASRPGEDFAFYPARELSGHHYFVDRRTKPSAAPLGSVGSEGHVAAILSKFCAGNQRARAWPPVSILKARKVSNIVVVDDAAISGHRSAKFTRDALMTTRAIRSSCSLGLTRMHLVAHTITKDAEDRFCQALQRWSRMRDEGRVEIHRADPLGLNSLDDVPGIRELASKYPPTLPPFLAGYRFGYAGSMSNTVFQHGCPNNVPALCWATVSGWLPLFPNRAVSAAMQSAIEWPQTAPVASRPGRGTVVAILEAQRRRRFTEAELRQATGLSTLTVRRACTWAKKLSLLDAEGHLTESGRREIKRFRREVAPAQEFEAPVAVAYNPKQLRASKVYV